MNNIKMAKGLEIKTNTERVTIDNNIVSGSTEKCEQLFNKDTIINGKALSSNGGMYDAINYFTSDAMIVKSNTGYALNSSFGGWMNFYSDNNTILYQSSSKIFTTRSDVKFIRICDLKTRINETMLIESTTAPSEYQPFFKGLRYGYYKGLQLDNFSYIDKTNKIKHKGGASYTFTGNETWAIQPQPSSYNLFIYVVNNAKVTSFVLSDTDYIDNQVLTINKSIRFSYLNYLYVRDDSISTVSDMAAKMKGKTINYQIATPSESNIEEF